MATMMTVKGQVTVPKPIRDELGLRPGKPVMFVKNAAGEVTIMAAPGDDERRRREADARQQAFRAWVAEVEADPIDLGMTTDDFMADLREPLPL